MATHNTSSQAKRSVQYMENSSYDEDFDVLTREVLEYDGVGLQRKPAKAMATKLTIDGNYVYFAKAKPGTAQETEKWQAKRIDTSSGLVITWADGDADFDNAATDLTALSYS